ncbi:MAG: tetratricopeptide repeat protein [Deltaproteobacteria bacterium]|nr:tetratricopeptide repeat protein [Deltaproteobacteria bacterium]
MRILRAAMVVAVLFAFTSCVAAPERKKEDASIHYRMGEVFFAERNYSSALAELTRAVEIYPDDPASRHLLGMTYFAKGMLPEAGTHLKKAVELKPDYAEAHVNLGVVYLELRDWDTAILHFNAALANIFYRTPDIAHYNLGAAYYGKGDFARAAESFKKTVEIDPQYAAAYNNLGQSYDRINRLDEAVEAYRKAVSIEPLYTNAYYNLGTVLIRKKDRKEALKAFTRVIELAPESDKAKSAREYVDLLK